MDKISITGGKKLNGTVYVSGSKNAILPLLFSSLLCSGEHTFYNVPSLKDVETTCTLLKYFGCDIQRNKKCLKINNRNLKLVQVPYQLVKQMRAGILALGPLLARFHKAEVSLPGGCAIGTRAVDLHLTGLQKMGAQIELINGMIVASVKGKLQGAKIQLKYSTVGGTENLMMAACLAQGPTIIENAAKEPEIVDLAKYLNKMGADIQGAGTHSIQITPKGDLSATEHMVIPDRIEAGTLLLAGAITQGNICVASCVPQDLEALILKLKQVGFGIKVNTDSIELSSPAVLSAVDITTAPHPGFPTDLQAQFMALMTQINTGISSIKEIIFENRFMHVQELVRLGANITVNAHVATIKGSRCLQGAPVIATDLRASACLVLAGLVAKGKTTISRVYHLDRGYEYLEQKLSSLGADIKRLK